MERTHFYPSEPKDVRASVVTVSPCQSFPPLLPHSQNAWSPSLLVAGSRARSLLDASKKRDQTAGSTVVACLKAGMMLDQSRQRGSTGFRAEGARGAEVIGFFMGRIGTGP